MKMLFQENKVSISKFFCKAPVVAPNLFFRGANASRLAVIIVSGVEVIGPLKYAINL